MMWISTFYVVALLLGVVPALVSSQLRERAAAAQPPQQRGGGSTDRKAARQDEKAAKLLAEARLDEHFAFCALGVGGSERLLCRPAIGVGPRAHSGGPIELRMASPPDGCAPSRFSDAVAGQRPDFALFVLRGKCTFVQKALNAQLSGAGAVLIADHTEGAPLMRVSHGGDTATAQRVSIPVATVHFESGAGIQSLLRLAQEGKSSRPAGESSGASPRPPLLSIRFESSWEASAERSLIEAALETHPRNPELHYRHGLALRRLADAEGADHAFGRCVALRPEHVKAHMALAASSEGNGRAQDALKHYRAAHEADHTHESGALYRLAWAYLQHDQKLNATGAYKLLWDRHLGNRRARSRPSGASPSSSSTPPAMRSVLANLARLELQVAAWQGLESHWAELGAQLEEGLASRPAGDNSAVEATNAGLPDPTHALGHPLNAKLIYGVAEHTSRRRSQDVKKAALALGLAQHHRSPAAPRAAKRRTLNVAYVSVDMDSAHPVGQKMVHLVGMHNRTAVAASVLAFRTSLMPPTPARVAATWRSNCPPPSSYHEIDVPVQIELDSTGSHAAVEMAEAILEEYVRGRIDVVVNIDGLAGQNGKGVRVRDALLAHPALPPSVTAFGFHSHVTSSSRLLTDSSAAAVGMDSLTDHPLRHAMLPHSSFVGISDAVIEFSPSRRYDVSVLSLLPWDLANRPSTVLCNFGDTAKITPQTWQSWMNILARLPGSALWLVRHAEEDGIFDNLRFEMAARGLSPDRLLLTGRLDESIHLLAKSHADLYLDTVPYNSHTTGHEVLAAGLPVITEVGATISGRVMESVLRDVQLGFLVCFTRREYENTAVRLGSSRLSTLEGLKKRVEATDFLPPRNWMPSFEKTLAAIAEEESAQSAARPAVAGGGSRGSVKQRRPMHVFLPKQEP